MQDYEVTRSDIKILKQIHSLGDEQYKRLMAYMKALQNRVEKRGRHLSAANVYSVQENADIFKLIVSIHNQFLFNMVFRQVL